MNEVCYWIFTVALYIAHKSSVEIEDIYIYYDKSYKIGSNQHRLESAYLEFK